MKSLSFILFLCLSLTAFAQEEHISSIRFAGKSFAVPAGCMSNSEYDVHNETFRFQFIPMMQQDYVNLSESIIASSQRSQDADQKDQFSKVPVLLYLNDQMATAGYKITYIQGGVKKYNLAAYGIINGLAVCAILTLYKDPKTNNDIPAFPRQMIRFAN